MPSTLLAFDPAEMFLRAYQEFQAGERSEREGQMRDALNRYATAAQALENIQRTDPEWQKMVVEYRLRKTQENLQRLRSSVTEAQLADIVVEDPLPTGGFEIDIPAPMVTTRPGSSPRVSPSRDGGESLKSELAEARQQIQKLKKDLEKTQGDLTGAKAEIDRTKTSLVEAKSELVQAKANLENVSAERDQLKNSAGKVSDKQLADLTVRIEQMEANNEVLNDENNRLRDKLDRAAKSIEDGQQTLAASEKDRQALAAERDKAVAGLKKPNGTRPTHQSARGDGEEVCRREAGTRKADRRSEAKARPLGQAGGRQQGPRRQIAKSRSRPSRRRKNRRRPEISRIAGRGNHALERPPRCGP
jgi:hypothetical protein